MIHSTLCYIMKDDKVLLLYRNKKENDLNEGKWIGVGGKFEEGETAEECMLREVFEETGLTVTKYHLHGVVKFVSDTWEDEDMYLFTAYDYVGTVNENCPEGTLKWIPKEQVLSLPTWEGDHYFLKPLLRGDKNIDMTVSYEGEKLVLSKNDYTPIEVETSSLLSYPHAFSTRIGGISEGIYESLNLGMNRGDSKERVTENWRRFLEAAGISNRSFVCGEQVHKNTVHIATKADLRPAYGPGELVVADGYVTKEKDVPLAIFTADCVPLLLEDKTAGVVGAIHCGWKSTVADIEKETIDKMCYLGAKPENICAAIGPAIDLCCFEVGKEVISAVEELIEEADSFYTIKENGKYMLDLRGVVQKRLVELGLNPDHIERVGSCTMCNPKRYWSHRYTKGERGSLACVISKEEICERN